MARRGSVAPLFALVTMALLAGCGEPSAPEASVPIVASVTVTPAGLTLAPGEEAQLSATVKGSSGNVLSEQPVTWSSSNPAVATVSPQGAVRALGVGSASITATAEFKSGSASITVVPPLSGIIVSEPVRLGAASGQGLVIDAGQNEFAYVSLAPDTVLAGDIAVITNLARGTPLGVPITNGGFDPVQIQALPGDTLEIRILRASGQVLARTLTLVPARKPPVVVRTDPPKDKTGVPLNAVIVVVLSEPVNRQTVTTETMNLRLGQQPVDGVLTLSADGLFAVFDPVEALTPGATYALEVTTGVVDLAGDALEQQVQVSFTTAQALSPLTGVIAFQRGYGGVPAAEICRLDLASSITTCLALGRAPAWSPDGSKIAFLSGDPPDIYVMNADGSGAVNLTNSPEGEFGGVAWSPDGQKIAYTVRVNVAAYDWDVFVMNADGSNRVNLTANPAADFASDWSPDGSTIAFDSDREGVSRPYLMNSDGSNVRRLSDDDQVGLGSWSPDGSKIVFVTARDGNAEIYVANADGTGAVNLTRDPARDVYPAWSADGTQIVFSSWRGTPSRGDPPHDIYVMNADGSGVRRITATEEEDPPRALADIAPHWRP